MPVSKSIDCQDKKWTTTIHLEDKKTMVMASFIVKETATYLRLIQPR